MNKRAIDTFFDNCLLLYLLRANYSMNSIDRTYLRWVQILEARVLNGKNYNKGNVWIDYWIFKTYWII